MIHLSYGQLALRNSTFLVLDDELDTEELLIGVPILGNVKMETRKLLDDKRAVLDGTDFQCFSDETKYRVCDQSHDLSKDKVDPRSVFQKCF